MTHFIVNTNARTFSRHPELIRQIERSCRGRGRLWVTRSVEELRDAARRIARDDARAVALCGGDGTFMAGVTEISRSYAERSLPAFAFVPGGTVATVVRNWGGTAQVLPFVECLLQRSPRSSVKRPSLRVREHGGDERIGFTVGTGLVARFFERYYAAGARGYATAFSIVSRIFIGSFVGDAYSRSVLDPLPCELEVDGKRLAPHAFSLIVCSVLRDLGLHLLVTYRGGDDPLRPHLVASPLPPRRLGPQAPRVLLGKPLIGPNSFDDLVGQFTVHFGPAGGPYVLDGDMFRAPSITVTAGPVLDVIEP